MVRGGRGGSGRRKSREHSLRGTENGLTVSRGYVVKKGAIVFIFLR